MLVINRTIEPDLKATEILLPVVCASAVGAAWVNAYGWPSGLMGSSLLIASIIVTMRSFRKLSGFAELAIIVPWGILVAAILFSWPLKTVWHFDPTTTKVSGSLNSANPPKKTPTERSKTPPLGRKKITLSDLLKNENEEEKVTSIKRKQSQNKNKEANGNEGRLFELEIQ
ncbi:MAG: hypothetical protein ABJQ90_18000 [Parasphingorhabdus sp.]